MKNADGTGERRITPWKLNAVDNDWSPDGSLISFRSEDTRSSNAGDIYAVRPDGSGLTLVTATPEFESAPDWSPAG